MEHLQIENWARWQSYRADRGQPPWIKIHRCVMRNPEWVELTDSERGQLVSMWLLAADNNGLIPSSPDLIQKLCFMSDPLDIDKFKNLGFIRQADVKAASKRRQSDCKVSHQSRVEKNREDKKRVLANPPDFGIKDSSKIYKSKSGKILSGEIFKSFITFWNVFNYKQGKADAADSWLKIDPDEALLRKILSAAKTEASARPGLFQKKQTPKMAQGWLSSRRWEDEFSEQVISRDTVFIVKPEHRGQE